MLRGRFTRNMSDNEIIEWMKKNYPKYASNLELGKILYSKHVLKQEYSERSSSDKIISIEDAKKLKLGERATVSGLVAKVSVISYMGCPICKKKNCDIHDEGEVEIKMYAFLLGDSTGTIWCSSSSAVEEGEEITVSGKIRDYKGGKEMSAFTLIKNKSNEDVVYDFVKKSGKVKYSVFLSVCEKNNLDAEELLKSGRFKEENSMVKVNE